MIGKRMGLAVLPLAIAGCTTMAEPPAVAGPCRVTKAMQIRYVAMRFRERMRPAIGRDAQARTSRVLRPGDAATMDFRPDRLNILLDDGGQIDGFRCG